MAFEWDERKNATNLDKHGISFEEAIQIFDGAIVMRPDARHNYGETRMLATGTLDDEIWTVVYTVRGDAWRIISAGEPVVANDEHIVRYTRENVPKGKTDWERVRNLTDEEIERAIREDPDAAPILDEDWFRQAELMIPPHLKHLWVQIDDDLMAWFRSQGEDWPAHINKALRAHVEQRAKTRRKAG